jgi:hypothetical protein
MWAILWLSTELSDERAMSKKVYNTSISDPYMLFPLKFTKSMFFLAMLVYRHASSLKLMKGL